MNLYPAKVKKFLYFLGPGNRVIKDEFDCYYFKLDPVRKEICNFDPKTEEKRQPKCPNWAKGGKRYERDH